jgi:signal transduction histidine kinase
VKGAPQSDAKVTRSPATRSLETQSASRAPLLERAEFAWLEREVVNVADREQERIGTDLHDSVGQDLMGIALMLRSVLAQLENEHSRACPDVERLVVLVNGAMQTTRKLARGLLPVSAEPGALAAALRELALRATERLQLKAAFIDACKFPLRLDTAAATHLYRIAQEALTNAIRHGHATRVTLRLAAFSGGLKLMIDDNGCGFERGPTGESAGLGVAIMRYRARMMGAKLHLETLADGGARVTCKCPITTAAHFLT